MCGCGWEDAQQTHDHDQRGRDRKDFFCFHFILLKRKLELVCSFDLSTVFIVIKFAKTPPFSKQTLAFPFVCVLYKKSNRIASPERLHIMASLGAPIHLSGRIIKRTLM